MNIIQWIESLTMDNIVEYSSIILLLLVIWTFWGYKAVINKLINKKGD